MKATETIGVVVCFLGVMSLLIFLLYYSEYIKVRIARRRESAFDVAAAEFYASLRRVQGVSTENQGTPTSGLSRASIASLPIIIIGAKGEGINSEHEKSCPICLSNYEQREALRVLPECLHRFHAVCVDEWLRVNATCPICRITPPLFSATV